MIPLAFLIISTFSGSTKASPASVSSNIPADLDACTSVTSTLPSSSTASSFCYSYLNLPTKTVTTTIYGTSTIYETATNASTTTLFLPGNGPTVLERDIAPNDEDKRVVPSRDNSLRNVNDFQYVKRASTYRSSYTIASDTKQSRTIQSADLTGSACSCLSLPMASATRTIIADYFTTLTVSVTTQTVYPCATSTDGSLPSPGPAYGQYQDSNDLGLTNDLYHINDTPEGASAQSCCNACFFELENCIQAWWYFYEGCVVSQATNLTTATGIGTSNVCPGGAFPGLSYVPDFDPAFQSTGDIAGPCGDAYTNE